MENIVDDITEWEKSYISIKMNLAENLSAPEHND